MDVIRRKMQNGWRDNTRQYTDPIGMTGRRPVEAEFAATVQDLHSKFDLQSGSIRSILDVGCNNGYLLKCLNTSIPLQTGVDFCLESLRSGKTVYPQLSTAQAEITMLPFRSRMFDRVLCYNMYHYLPDIETGLNAADELFRILALNGELLIGDIYTAEHKHLIPQADRDHWNAPDRPFLHRMENWLFMPIEQLRQRFLDQGGTVKIWPQNKDVRCPGYRYDLWVRKEGTNI
jgi:SAM-dependent methyltransferase